VIGGIALYSYQGLIFDRASTSGRLRKTLISDSSAGESRGFWAQLPIELRKPKTEKLERTPVDGSLHQRPPNLL